MRTSRTKRYSSDIKLDYQKVGNLISCLYYLLRETEKSELDEVSTIIKQAIVQTVRIASQNHKEQLGEIKNSIIEEQVHFLDSLESIANEEIKQEIKRILVNAV